MRPRLHGYLVLVAVLFGASPDRVSAGPTRCPWRFDERTTGLPAACVFVGRYNPTCGDELIAVFAGDGTALVVSVSSAMSVPLFIPAEVLSATEGKVVRWQADLQLEHAQRVGTVRLEDDGQRLLLRLAVGTLVAHGCRFEEFSGRFVGMTTADTPAPDLRSQIAAAP